MIKIVNNYFLYYSSFLILILPFALVSGPFISDLIIVVISLITIFNLKKIISNLSIKKIFYIYLIFFFYLLINTFFSNFFLQSLIPAITYIRFILFLIFFSFIFLNFEKFKKKLLSSLLLIFTIISFDVILEFFVGSNILGYKYNGQRIQSLFGDEWIVGSYISKILPLIISLFFCSIKNRVDNISEQKQILVISFILGLSIFVIVLSGERSALFSAILYSFLLLIFLNFKFYYKFFVLILILIIFLFSIFGFKETFNRIYQQTYAQLNIFSKDYKKDHQMIFETSYKIFKDNNKLIGVGLKGFRFKCKEEKYYTKIGCTTHPHNFYLLFLVELGIFGVFFLIIFFAYLSVILLQKYFKLGKNILHNKIYDNDTISILLGLYVFIFPFKTHGNFFNNWLSICFILQLSLLVATYLNYSKLNEKL